MRRSLMFCAAVAAGVLFGLPPGGALAQDGLAAPQAEPAEAEPGAESALPGVRFADPETGLVGRVGAWVFYSAQDGVTGGVDARFRVPAGQEASVSLGLEAAKDRRRGSVGWHQGHAFGTGASFDLELRGQAGEARDQLQFAASSVGVDGRLTWNLSEATRLGAHLGHARNRLSEPGAGISALVLPDLGTTRRTVLGADVAHEFSVPGGALSLARLNFGLDLAHVSDGRRQVQGSAGLGLGGALADRKVVWRADLRAGALSTRGGASLIGERYILGASSIRGFAYGGFGPHDGTQTLGGNRFALMRLDLAFPQAFGAGAVFVPGLHADMGALWGLDRGLATVDAGAHARASVGVTLSANIGAGALSVNLSRAVARQPGDQTQTFELSFHERF